MAVHASVRVGHAPTSKIYSPARVGHTPACVGRMKKWLMAERSGETRDHGGMTIVAMKLLEVDRSEFEKIKSNNFNKGADQRLRTT
jgi:hypothetical protein